MKRIDCRPVVYLMLALVTAITGCSSSPAPDATNQSAAPPATSTANTAATPRVPPPAGKGGGTLQASPNPIKVCDGSGYGITTLTYTFSLPIEGVKICVGNPSCEANIVTTTEPGKVTTGKWVGDGTVFYLQDVTNGKPLTAENTITTLTVNLTNAGC